MELGSNAASDSTEGAHWSESDHTKPDPLRGPDSNETDTQTGGSGQGVIDPSQYSIADAQEDNPQPQTGENLQAAGDVAENLPALSVLFNSEASSEQSPELDPRDKLVSSRTVTNPDERSFPGPEPEPPRSIEPVLCPPADAESLASSSDISSLKTSNESRYKFFGAEPSESSLNGQAPTSDIPEEDTSAVNLEAPAIVRSEAAMEVGKYGSLRSKETEPLSPSDGTGTTASSLHDTDQSDFVARRNVQYLPTADGSSRELKLKPFQTEISQRALTGANDIISLPTGTGKTIIAISIIKEHLKLYPEGKVIFFVPTTALANQQLAKIRLYIQAQYKCEKITGDERLSVEALKLKLKNKSMRVFVVTPAIIENYLKGRHEASITEFSLIIMDECHHAKKKHPYRRLLEICLESKMNNRESAIPQLIGLTATVGVGGAKDIWSAEDFLVEMCALFQMSEPPSRVVENVDSLNFATNNPDEDVVIVENVRSDPVLEYIHGKLMIEVEEFIKQHAPTVLSVAIEFPDGRSTQQYEQYVVTMITETQEAISKDKEAQKRVILGFMYLRLYQRALNLINLLTGAHGLKYLNKELSDPRYLSIPELWKSYYDMTERNLLLEQVENEQRGYPNMKLRKLVEIIKNTLDKEPNSRIMIFVKERVVSTVLTDYLNGRYENFKCVYYTSAGPSTFEGGMNPQEQEKALKSFESGSKNIMVATSIAEEGLDIQECNLTIQYMYVKDMIAKLQTKGRTRAFTGKFISIVDHKLCLQDECNEHKQDLMIRALENLQERKGTDFQRRLNDANATIKNKIEQPEVSSPPKIRHQHGTVLCSLCQAELGSVDSIKQYMDSQHLVMDEQLHEKVRTDGIKDELKCKGKGSKTGHY